jgi:hypothetical protein
MLLIYKEVNLDLLYQYPLDNFIGHYSSKGQIPVRLIFSFLYLFTSERFRDFFLSENTMIDSTLYLYGTIYFYYKMHAPQF